MKIEELINKKMRKVKIIGFLFWLAFGAMIFIPKDGNLFYLSLIPFIGFGGTIIYLMYFIKCPKCYAQLGQASMSSGNIFSKKSKLNFCPNCGVNFSEHV